MLRLIEFSDLDILFCDLYQCANVYYDQLSFNFVTDHILWLEWMVVKNSDKSSTGCCCPSYSLPLFKYLLMTFTLVTLILRSVSFSATTWNWSLAQSLIMGAFLKWNKDKVTLCSSESDFAFHAFFNNWILRVFSKWFNKDLRLKEIVVSLRHQTTF